MKIRSENMHFILVEPETPGNVGAAARALKTMGFSRLVLVNPCDHLAPEARWMAHASEEVLENARVCTSLSEALDGIHFAAAASQRVRGYHFPFFTPAELGARVVPVTQEHRAALVFGRERTGLTNEEIRCCHAISTIPAAVDHPSLNLAQAVMLYASELFGHSFTAERSFKWELATHNEIEELYAHLEKSLRHSGFRPRDNWESFMMRFRRIVGRALPEKRDIKLLHKIFHSFDVHMQRLENRQKEK